MKVRATLLALAVAVMLAGSANAADLTASLNKGTIELKSAGPLAFGPDGVLFIGDTSAATIYAVATDDTKEAKKEKFKVEGVNEKIANALGVDAKKLTISDMAANPMSGLVYFSVTRGTGTDAKPAIVRVDAKGKITEFALKDVKFSKVVLPNASEKKRQEAITQISYVKGQLIVAGLSNEEFESKLRTIPFPFKEADKGASVQIWHTSHNALETKSPVRTFVAYDINGETNLLAAYTCTPLVKFPISQLKPGEKIKGTTIAELGNRNVPLKMIVYQKGGKDFLLMANSARGVMKVPLDGVGAAKPITEPIKPGDTAGIAYETIKDLNGVEHLDVFDKDHALIVFRAKKDGPATLDTIELP